MSKLYLTTLLLFSFHFSYSQLIDRKVFKKVIKFEEYENIINKKDDVLYVVNFWATWCGPCVREIPDFMEVNNQLADRSDFKMLLISLDSKSDLSEEVLPFLIKNNITADVYLLDDNKRMNFWMPRVDRSWSGSIPATVFYKNKKKLHFVEQQLHKDELLATIYQYIKL
ncbi:MAG: TlpA disulfide reductase family protein [Paludibacter sp.]|nr:TlpA disulfide reductase family protein [Paludibacter sp.]